MGVGGSAVTHRHKGCQRPHRRCSAAALARLGRGRLEADGPGDDVGPWSFEGGDLAISRPIVVIVCMGSSSDR